ncbi:hypothetical protein [Pedobacter sp. FW305-3-2-15-E-R2A2]|uniref:hypothetical protein n=1 Tax=Pedobacter sp. FW305-3-2-15-E-R2A2 TaxID=3140251 RepID=UPI0031409FDE
MEIIRNLDKLSDVLTPDAIVRVQNEASNYLKQDNLFFTVLSYEQEGLTVKVEQDRPLTEKIYTFDELVFIAKDLFGRYIINEVFAHPHPYVESPAEVVNGKWVQLHMNHYEIRLKNVAFQTGIDKTNLSAWINEKRPMSRIVKAMFFNFFKVYAINDLVTNLSGEYKGYYYIKKYFGIELVERLVSLTKHKDVVITESGEDIKIFIP